MWHAIRFLPVRYDWITELCERAKGETVLLLTSGVHDQTLISTTEAFEDVLKTQYENFSKGTIRCQYGHGLFGDGIFAADGENWVHQRKTASKLFTMRAHRDSMTTTIQHKALVLECNLTRAASSNETVDLFRLFNCFTMEAFAEIGFGMCMNCLDVEEDHPLQPAFDRSQHVIVLRFIRPSWVWKARRFLGVGMEGQLHRDLEVINSAVLDIAEKALQRHAIGEEQEFNNIVSLLLKSTPSSTDGTETPLNPTFLCDIVMNFLIAGRDTTAQALCWLFYNLNQSPGVETQIRRELEEKLPELMTGACAGPSMEQTSELVYLEAALRETLRLYPSVP